MTGLKTAGFQRNLLPPSSGVTSLETAIVTLFVVRNSGVRFLRKICFSLVWRVFASRFPAIYYVHLFSLLNKYRIFSQLFLVALLEFDIGIFTFSGKFCVRVVMYGVLSCSIACS